MVPRKKITGKKVLGNMILVQMVRRKLGPEKGPQKIVLHQGKSSKFERISYFYRLILVSGRRGLFILWSFFPVAILSWYRNQSIKIENLFKFVRITSTENNFLRTFFVGTIFSKIIFPGIFFPRTIFPGTFFPRTVYNRCKSSLFHEIKLKFLL